jgi:hypothetical protein
VLDAVADGVLCRPEAAAYLHGVAAGYDHREARIRTELVWTGPTAFDVPVRATAPVLTALVNEALQELILTAELTA